MNTDTNKIEFENKIVFEIKGELIYDGIRLTRNFTEIKIDDDSSSKGMSQAKLLIANKIKGFKNKSSGQNGGYNCPKNSTEYKKQKQIMRTKTLRFKSTPNNKTYKK